jgi:hypothetical protein
MRYNNRLRTRKNAPIIVVGVLVVIAASITAVLIFHPFNKLAVLPRQITDAANFNLYVPAQDSDGSDKSTWGLIHESASFDKTSGVVSTSYKQAANKTIVVVTQQASPDVFSDVPQQYSRVLSSLNEYAELQTSFGAVALTHPKELNGSQSAVANKAGTLLFAKPSADLSNDQWKQFFETMRIIR